MDPGEGQDSQMVRTTMKNIPAVIRVYSFFRRLCWLITEVHDRLESSHLCLCRLLRVLPFRPLRPDCVSDTDGRSSPQGRSLVLECELTGTYDPLGE